MTVVVVDGVLYVPAGSQAAQSAPPDIVTAARALVAIWDQMATSGMPPHSDFWDQSEDACRQALKRAVRPDPPDRSKVPLSLAQTIEFPLSPKLPENPKT